MKNFKEQAEERIQTFQNYLRSKHAEYRDSKIINNYASQIQVLIQVGEYFLERHKNLHEMLGNASLVELMRMTFQDRKKAADIQDLWEEYHEIQEAVKKLKESIK